MKVVFLMVVCLIVGACGYSYLDNRVKEEQDRTDRNVRLYVRASGKDSADWTCEGTDCVLSFSKIHKLDCSGNVCREVVNHDR